MGALDKIAGKPLQEVRRLIHTAPLQFAVNATVARIAIALPPGVGPHRIEKIAVACSAVPSDVDGTMLLNVKNNDISEGATDNLVVSQDLETLVTALNRAFACAFAAETTERELTIEAGDVVTIELVNNSAAIDVNPFVTVVITLLPLDMLGDQNVKRQSSY